MRRGDRTVLICDCGGTMDIDGRKLAKACGGTGDEVFTALCRREIGRFVDALGGDGPLDVGCIQESPVFAEVAEDHDAGGRVGFFNIRETAGWSDEGAGALPKMAALIAEAALPVPASRALTLTSEGTCLVYGSGQTVLDAARRLSDALSVTCMMLDADDALPPTSVDFPIVTGRIRQATGRFGAFEVTVDRFAERTPFVRNGFGFERPVDGARSECDVIVDLSGEPTLFPAPEKRDGYLRADPRDPASVLTVLLEASTLVGEFEKPIYVNVDQGLCAHSRNRKTGCTRCLDLCPAGAIAPDGDAVAVDPALCGGCGLCAGACPTSAITYAYPDVQSVHQRIMTLAAAYRDAGGRAPRLLVHDDKAGTRLIEAAARYGRGLPADAIPMAVNEVGQVGHDILLGALAQGFQEVVLLTDPQRPDDYAGLAAQIAVTEAILTGLGDAGGRVRVLDTGDPEALSESLFGSRPATILPTATFVPLGRKKAITRLAAKGLAAALGASVEAVPLPEGAPYGRVAVDTGGCTLCLACVSACPAGALQDNPDRPQLLFQEDACVQCGLCATTCPEKVITLEPRYALADSALSAQLLFEDEPYACISCGKEFGTKRSIEAIVSRLSGKHWMFATGDRANLIRMCEDCRVQVQFQSTDNPMAGPPRRVPRTTADYERAREEGRELDDE
ncbi:ferredoxin [Thalassobaculum fulvum]|uniref:Ferredoxin n=1 Tax=Thalassobaculum fulvum TaxID=1633335 RepID=A0A918XPW0_9PROT|nr:4Fe-4S binding protein [Thalassobaculum fulvum]GHD45754.1 ferredoxin [Thalassobaculum fulvum]